MKVYGTFKTRNNDTITVTFYNTLLNGTDINIDESDDIRFDEDPVNIRREVEEVFTHVITTSCEIRLVTKQWLGDFFFVKNQRNCVVNVHKNNDLIFAGYVTARTYNQPYAKVWETVTINCIDKLQMLDNEKITNSMDYKKLKQSSLTYSFSYLLETIGMKDTDLDLNVYPDISATSSWTPTGFREYNGDYVTVETALNVLDANTAVSTGEKRDGAVLTTTWVTSNDTVADNNGMLHYVEYETVTVNGVQQRTGKTREGNLAGQPVEDLSYERFFVPTGVRKVSAGDYYEYGQWMAYLTNGHVVSMTDGLGEHLPCDYRYGGVDAVDDNGYRIKYAHVEYNEEDYYFKDDVIQGMKVGKYNVEGRCDGEYFDIIYNMYPATIENTPDINGTYLWYIDDDVEFEPRDQMFMNNKHITDVEYINTIYGSWKYEGYDMYNRCSYLKTGFVPHNLGRCNRMFSYCPNVTTILCSGSVPTSYDNFFEGANEHATFYVEPAYINDWQSAFPNNEVNDITYFYKI